MRPGQNVYTFIHFTLLNYIQLNNRCYKYYICVFSPLLITQLEKEIRGFVAITPHKQLNMYLSMGLLRC